METTISEIGRVLSKSSAAGSGKSGPQCTVIPAGVCTLSARVHPKWFVFASDRPRLLF